MHICRAPRAIPLRALLVAALLVLAGSSPLHAAPASLHIDVLSNRPEMLSGGDALIQIRAERSLDLHRVRVTLNGADVTAAFRLDEASHALMGLVTGLNDGKNTLIAEAGGASGGKASMTLVNHPITGPVFAGPKEAPFVCETENFKLRSGGTLGPALDANCSAKTRIDYVYRSSAGGDLSPCRTPRLPRRMSPITTSIGAAVPYIIRIETGTINRAIYQISMLHNPAHEPNPDFSTKPAGWNGRLIYAFGGGCMNGWYRQGSSTGGVDDDFMLRQGYAVASSTLNVYGNNCDDLLSAETLMMVKEHFIEAYGVPKFTIGWGCSGGAEQVQPIAQNYPGLLDGIIPGCSFADAAFSIVPSITDARLLNHYFTLAAMPYSEQQKLRSADMSAWPPCCWLTRLSRDGSKSTNFAPRFCRSRCVSIAR